MRDEEKGWVSPENSSFSATAADFVAEPQPRKGWSGFKDSFQPAKVLFDTTGLTEQEIALRKLEIRTKDAKLSKRHTFIASLAGCVGTGLFIGSGNSLKAGGPAGLILGFGIMALAVISFVCALGEICVRYRASAYTSYISRFIDPSWGFAVSWAYAACWLVMMPLELIAAAMVIDYWKSDNNAAAQANPVAWVAIFYVAISLLTFFGIRGYGEVEFVLSGIKVLATIGFIIFGIVVAAGGGPTHHYFGGHYFHDPGAFANGFKGVVIAFINSAFAYGGTEVVGIAAARTKNPRRTFPSAIKQVFWRIALFFFASVVVISCLVPYTNVDLGTSSSGSASPFVIAIQNSGVRALPSVFNAVIMISVLSVANAAAFAGPQIIVSLAYEGHAPKMLGYIDRKGRPLAAIGLTLIVGLLCFLAAYDEYYKVFNWLYAFVSLSFLFTWVSICVIHIRHRFALQSRNISLSELQYKSPFGVWGSVVGVIIITLIIIFQFWIGLYPLGGNSPSAEVFFQNWLSVPVTLVMFIGHKLFTRSKFVLQRDLPVDIHLMEYDPDEVALENELHEHRKRSNWLYRMASFWC